MLEYERLQRAIVDFPNAVTFWVSGNVRLREGSVEPISQSLAVSDQCHAKAPLFPVGFRAIEAQILQPVVVRYE
jgi:hypothetical protein